VDLFQEKFKSGIQGTLMSDALASTLLVTSKADGSGQLTDIPSQITSALSLWIHRQSSDIRNAATPQRVVLFDKINYRGASYKPKNISQRDSFIVTGEPDNWKPAQIQHIFNVNFYLPGVMKTFTLLAIKRFPELSKTHTTFDHYRKFPLQAGGRICYSEEFPNVEVIDVTDILSHFARTLGVCSEITKNHMHVLPLDRVCFLILPATCSR
jgi:hypothetical protein